jgi:CHRD domain
MKKILVVLAGLSLVVVGFGTASAQGGIDHMVEADLNGFAEVNSTTGAFGNGELAGDGFGLILLDANDGKVCFEVSWSDIDEPFAGHIHAAPVGMNGGIVVDLLGNADRFRHNVDSGIGRASGCVEGVDSALVADIGTNPASYYVNIHNDPFPGGAVRGQLENDEVE